MPQNQLLSLTEVRREGKTFATKARDVRRIGLDSGDCRPTDFSFPETEVKYLIYFIYFYSQKHNIFE